MYWCKRLPLEKKQIDRGNVRKMETVQQRPKKKIPIKRILLITIAAILILAIGVGIWAYLQVKKSPYRKRLVNEQCPG